MLFNNVCIWVYQYAYIYIHMRIYINIYYMIYGLHEWRGAL